METLIIPCIPIPSDFSPKPIKSIVSLSKTHQSYPSKSMDIAHLLRIGHFKEAITALDKISQNGIKLKVDYYTKLLDFCIDVTSVEFGRELHARVDMVDGVGVNPFVATKLVSMYVKCGCLSDARKVFDEMPERNLFTWSAMIGAYSREQRWSEVVKLFGMMMKEGILPDGFLFPKILQACGNCGDFETGKSIHSLVIRGGMRSSSRVENALLAVYAKCGELSLADKLFEEINERDIVSWNALISGYCQKGENGKAHMLFNLMRDEGIEPCLITWNILIAGYSQSGDCDVAMELMRKMGDYGMSPDVFTWTSLVSGLAQKNRIVEALQLFREMLLVDVQPNGVTLATAISTCASTKSLEKGKELHSIAVKLGISDNVLVGNALIDMYSKCGELYLASKVFEMVQDKDVYTWNSMIGGYSQDGYCGKAHDLFVRMQASEVAPNTVTWNVMISGYLQNGDEDQAMGLFRMMGREGIVKPNTSSWNSIISAYLQNGRKNKALEFFRKMQNLYFRPNPVTVLTILPAFDNLIAANKVKEIHAFVLRGNFDSHMAISNSLIDIYAKSGNIEYSRSVFDWMSSKDIISWNSMIASYVLHGRSADAINVFDQMIWEGVSRNRAAFASLILAYSQAKMVEKGKQVYFSLTNDYQITPGSEHYLAMVDLFGRSGRLKEAMEFIQSMETEPDSAIWDAFLTASRFHGSVACVIHASEQLLKLNPSNDMAYRLVSLAYQASGRSIIPVKERSPPPRGCSLLELQNVVYEFVSGHNAIPDLSSIYKWLKSIEDNVKLPISKNMACIDEEAEEDICGVHSEKLSLAFALISSQCKIKCIRIMKNFRICESCHHTAKYISSTYGCEILISDTKCLHHFRNGHCSCGDYW
ncbi:hypothetical protein KSS87_010507 [Heliosperma pusillum]|nr:hypothetical protein KSS87_010507 [Heliosperma pusillum]